MEQNITVDSNTTNLETLSEFEWGIRGYDPAHGTISNLNSENGISFEIVDGNFTDYLESPYGNSTATFDLGSIPVGKYFLKYRATDEYDNISEFDIIQNIEVRDAQVPFISFLLQGGGITTLPEDFSDATDLRNSNSSAVLEWNVTESLLFSDKGDDDSDVYLKLFDLKNVFDDEFNNENQPDWNVTIQFSSSWDYDYTTPSELDLSLIHI